MKRVLYRILLCVSISCSVASCATNDIVEESSLNTVPEGAVSFENTMAKFTDETLTKGSLINYILTQVKTVDAAAFRSSNGECYIEMQAVDPNGTWSFYTNQYWPSEDIEPTLDFVSVLPTVDDTNGLTLDDYTQYSITMSYEVPSLCTNQPDLMMAIEPNSVNPEAVNLHYEHALAAIGFSYKNERDFPDPNKRIYSIEFKQVVSKGTVKYSKESDAESMSAGTFTWTDLNEPSDFMTYCDTSVRPMFTSQSIALEDGYLMMIPQVFEEDVTAVVTFCHPLGGCMESYDVLIPAGTEWKCGELYNYIVEDDRFIEYEGRDDGLSNCYMLHPLASGDRTYYIPIDERINEFWHEYAQDDDDDEEAEWFLICDKVGLDTEVIWHDCTGGIDGLDFSIIDWEIDADEFVNNSGKVTPNTSSTASVVNYITPSAQVAMKVVLPSSFDSNHGNVSVAVWRDLNGDGVRNTATASDEDGNVVAVNETLWSWHLWITDYNPDVAPTQNMTHTFDVTGGRVHEYVDDAEYMINATTAIWDAGGMYGSNNGNKFIMDRHIGATGKYNTLDSEGTPQLNMGGITYDKGFVVYQFGRKDPFPGQSTYYQNDYSYTHITGRASFNEAVHNPSSFYSAGSNWGNWCDQSIDAAYSLRLLWNDIKVPNPYPTTADHSGYPLESYYNGSNDATDFVSSALDSSVDNFSNHVYATDNYEKSIFDPSPLGWRLPVSGVWSDFYITVGTATDNGKFEVSTVGGDYTNVEQSDGSYVKTLTSAYYWMYKNYTWDVYPMSGYMERSIGTSDGGRYGFCRTASPSIQNPDYDFYSANSSQESGAYLHITDFAYILCLSTSGSTSNYSYLRAHGMPARAVQE